MFALFFLLSSWLYLLTQLDGPAATQATQIIATNGTTRPPYATKHLKSLKKHARNLRRWIIFCQWGLAIILWVLMREKTALPIPKGFWALNSMSARNNSRHVTRSVKKSGEGHMIHKFSIWVLSSLSNMS